MISLACSTTAHWPMKHKERKMRVADKRNWYGGHQYTEPNRHYQITWPLLNSVTFCLLSFCRYRKFSGQEKVGLCLIHFSQLFGLDFWLNANILYMWRIFFCWILGAFQNYIFWAFCVFFNTLFICRFCIVWYMINETIAHWN